MILWITENKNRQRKTDEESLNVPFQREWENHQTNDYKAWSIEVIEENVAEEINYLRSTIYCSSINIPIEVFDAYSRFSYNPQYLKNDIKYQDKISWAKRLCSQ